MLLQSASEHYRRQRRITVIALAGARREAQRGNLDRLVKVVAAAQIAAATDAAQSVPDMLDEQGVRSSAAAEVEPLAVAGVASDGRPLASLLQLVARRDAPVGALDRVVSTQIADAGRAGSSLAIAARPQVGGYVRMLVPPSCSRCAILAGKWFAYNAGFQRHPFVTAGMCRLPKMWPTR